MGEPARDPAGRGGPPGSAAPDPGAGTGRTAPAGREDGPWRAFRRWRHHRPFGAGIAVALGGAEILLTQRASVSVVLTAGADSLAGYVLPMVMVVCGLLIVLNPAQRLFYSVVAVLASLASWITSNLGGFLIGMLLGVIGSSLAFGWLPDQPRRRRWRTRRAASGGTEDAAPVT